MKEYMGTLDRLRLKDNHRERKALETYYSMCKRSKKQGLPRPEMTIREFMGWFLEETKNWSYDIRGNGPSVSRLDHAKGYSWDNFIVEPMKENSRESSHRNRLGPKTRMKTGKKVLVYRKDGVFTGQIPNIRCAAQFFGVSQRMVQFLVRGKVKTCRKINFDLKLEAQNG